MLECGRRYRDEDYARSTWQLRKFLWAPYLGLRGIFRLTPFKDVFVASGAGVGGGSIVYANTLYRAAPAFFANPQWAGLDDWPAALAPHYATAERMLGVNMVPFDSDNQKLLKQVGAAFGVEHTFTRTPCAVYFGEPNVTVPDPYFGGEGPERTGCTRCGACMVGCRTGAKNTLLKNYLWFAERKGVADHTGAPGGRHPSARLAGRRRRLHDRDRASRRLVPQAPAHVHGPRRDPRGRCAGNQSPARDLQALGIAAGSVRSGRQARAHQQRIHSRGDAAEAARRSSLRATSRSARAFIRARTRTSSSSPMGRRATSCRSCSR